ncbi:hypothetical protein MRB53_032099 [Persea americana]|uniref:Uncharacterized protein n=1 Tax=Persea americana TaxID=3435 RepID=A0ACC2KRE2_PERAE|nr:hypothetical protein MRB53_032099 [Persea americana]
MGKGNSSFSLFKIFKFFTPRKSYDEGMTEAELQSKGRRHCNDDDGAELEIDKKASAFIHKFHAARVMDSELQTVPNV